MDTVFLSCSFRPEDEKLRKQVTRMIESHRLRVVTGDELDGRELSQALKEQIALSDALVAIVARRQPGPTSQWVLDELAHARAFNKPTLALWDRAVPVAGASTQYERAEFDAGDPVDALIKLSNSLGTWRDRSGHTLRVMILPTTVAQHARQPDFKCEYRFTRNGNETPWQTAKVTAETGGAIAFLRTPNLTDNIELKVTVNNRVYTSLAQPQQVPIKLETDA